MVRYSGFLLFAFVLSYLNEAKSQEQRPIRDAIILKDGRAYVGTLLEDSHPDSLGLATSEGQVLKFHRSTVSTITKENVLKGFMPTGSLTRQRLVVTAGGGYNAKATYGTMLMIAAGYILPSRFYVEAEFQYHGGSTSFASPTINSITFLPDGTRQRIVHKTFLREDTRASFVSFLLGMEMGKGAIRIRPYVGIGIANMKSGIDYLDDTYDDEYIRTRFIDTPLDGKTTYLTVPLGLHFSYSVLDFLVFGVSLQNHFILSPPIKEAAKEYFSFVEKRENPFTIVAYIGVEL